MKGKSESKNSKLFALLWLRIGKEGWGPCQKKVTKVSRVLANANYFQQRDYEKRELCGVVTREDRTVVGNIKVQ